MAFKAREITRPDFQWVHAVSPDLPDLEALASKFQITSSFVRDCLEPEHLPKFELLDGNNHLILRAFDSEAKEKLDTIQGLTRKLAIFFSAKFVLTVTRKEQGYVTSVFEAAENSGRPGCTGKIVSELLLGMIATYESAVIDAYARFEEFENDVFKHGARTKLGRGYQIKRRAMILRRMLRLMREALTEMQQTASTKTGIEFNRIKGRIDKLLFQLDEVQDNIGNLLSLQVSIASQRTNESSYKTNEVMRVLTVLSVFFMPLNFVAGVFGMNFQSMPWIHTETGFFWSMGLMVGTAAAVLLWFRYKGWLNRF